MALGETEARPVLPSRGLLLNQENGWNKEQFRRPQSPDDLGYDYRLARPTRKHHDHIIPFTLLHYA